MNAQVDVPPCQPFSACSGVFQMRSQIQNILCFVICSLICSLVPQCISAEDFSDADFRALHKQLQPGDEPWRTIPWRISLPDAQRHSVKTNKPIFIWAMDGHPLGCT